MIIMIVIMIAIMIMIISNIVYIIILYIFISQQVQAVPWAPGLKKICEISKVLWEWIFNSSLWQLPIYDYQLKCRYCESENKPITDLVNAKVRNIKKVHRWNSFWPSFPLFYNCNKARHNWMGFTGVWWQQPGISEHALPIQFQHYYILTREANENKIANKTSQTLNNINKNFCLVSALPLTSWLPKKNLKACLQRFYSLQKFSGVFTL